MCFTSWVRWQVDVIIGWLHDNELCVSLSGLCYKMATILMMMMMMILKHWHENIVEPINWRLTHFAHTFNYIETRTKTRTIDRICCKQEWDWLMSAGLMSSAKGFYTWREGGENCLKSYSCRIISKRMSHSDCADKLVTKGEGGVWGYQLEDDNTAWQVVSGGRYNPHDCVHQSYKHSLFNVCLDRKHNMHTDTLVDAFVS